MEFIVTWNKKLVFFKLVFFKLVFFKLVKK